MIINTLYKCWVEMKSIVSINNIYLEHLILLTQVEPQYPFGRDKETHSHNFLKLNTNFTKISQSLKKNEYIMCIQS